MTSLSMVVTMGYFQPNSAVPEATISKVLWLIRRRLLHTSRKFPMRMTVMRSLVWSVAHGVELAM